MSLHFFSISDHILLILLLICPTLRALILFVMHALIWRSFLSLICLVWISFIIRGFLFCFMIFSLKSIRILCIIIPVYCIHSAFIRSSFISFTAISLAIYFIGIISLPSHYASVSLNTFCYKN